MQLHFAAIRNLNSAMSAKLGPDTGYDAVGDSVQARPLATFLDALAREGAPPQGRAVLAQPERLRGPRLRNGLLPGWLRGGQAPARLAWWFNDHLDGMRRQLSTLAGMGLLGRFVGMLTDSRSFLSFPRHEYFRRILCGLVGGWVERGEAPADFEALGTLVRGVSYGNARDFFGIPGLRG